MTGLKGRTAIVTGAARGIGKAIALRLAAEGANIVVIDVLDTEPAVAQIVRTGVHALGMRVDVSSESEVAAMTERTLREFGRIDILVNNAAMTTPPRPFEQITAEDWRRMMEVNTLGPFLCARAVIDFMRSRKHGRIINIASDTAHLGVPFMLHYVSSKGALIAFTRALAREVGKDGVTVNAIAPGFTLSERIAAQTERVEVFRREVTARALAIARDELPEDLVGAASFLAGDESSFMTGQTLVVDGGFAMV
ncbi:MAG: dehydrogenase [Betaproteobacteria bacterium RIFCSPLOWO2_02_FULL_65_24]|nr:MAG: dehydrogenase [Betaproteobacteria bacterium RIFCSPLOWO2_02_FULL_65_24]